MITYILITNPLLPANRPIVRSCFVPQNSAHTAMFLEPYPRIHRRSLDRQRTKRDFLDSRSV